MTWSWVVLLAFGLGLQVGGLLMLWVVARRFAEALARARHAAGEQAGPASESPSRPRLVKDRK